MKDRTHEFSAIVNTTSLRSRNERPSPDLKRPSANDHHPLVPKSEFIRIALAISRDINSTSSKLDKLAKLAKRKTLFDDKPVEISELTNIIKQEIAKLNKQIALLQQYVRDSKRKVTSKQAAENSANIVVLLQSKLANLSMSFKDVLEIRTQNIKQSKSRQEQFMLTSPESTPSRTMSDSPLYNLNRRNSTSKNDYLAIDLATPSTENPAQQYQQQSQLLITEQDTNYIESRSTAIQSIESTIAELGSIFQQLAQMVAEQRETVQRIDQDVDDIEMNVSNAQKELLKYYASISSNRWLMLKVFATVIVFFVVFTFVS
ncbi:uncharacterized protein VTP21DRAFT_3070 [Calcarisporiella thermophila]|uniref:uncharacterized protein n=1 Tax=Calcarisporiella thermophila TaxID=911321 RepID=UPI0037435BAD